MMRIAWHVNKGLFSLLVTLVAAGAALPGYAQQTSPIRLEVSTRSLNKLINWVALEEGLYKKNGLDVQPSMSAGFAAMIKKDSGVEVPPQYVRAGGVGIPLDEKTPSPLKAGYSGSPP